MSAFLEAFNIVYDNFLMHYGVSKLDGSPGRGSGRYELGSGEDPYQHSSSFLERYELLKNQNPTYTDPATGKTYTGESAIARMMGYKSTTKFRIDKSIEISNERTDKYNVAQRLRNSGMGYSEIGRAMGINESSVRSLLNAGAKDNMERARNTAEFLKQQIEEKGMIDIGPGVENYLGISRDKLNQAVAILEKEGYVNLKGGLKNITDPTGTNQINMNVIAPIGSKSSDIYSYGDIQFMSEADYNAFREKMGIATITEFKSTDNGETYIKNYVYPESMDSSRLKINYADDGSGGIDKDGTIEIRRGVEDLSLGNATYAQVRILVDGNRYLKGMAVYADDSEFPDGVDVIFNTNKTKDTPKLEVLKDTAKNLAKDPDNPFGSTIKENGQYEYTGSDGKKHLGLINKTREEGDWNQWKDKLPSQFLSKQRTQLAERQLNLAIKEKEQEYNDICALENNTLKKSLLETYASDCDSASVHLYAAALPRQKHQVLISVPSMKDDEVYAPNYKDGEKVCLVRYPHGGTFEIPELTVNNKQADAVKTLGKVSKDCVAVNSKVAARLSGADFDGDTVMVIPTKSNGIKISTSKPLKGLEGFDPKTTYATTKKVDSNGKERYFNKYGQEVKIMSNTNTQMGIISNLITDMTIAGATTDELARAVRHSMVVIDAEKHKLDYRSSEKENAIASLKKKYQGYTTESGDEKGGASTLISRAKSEVNVEKTQGSGKVNVKYDKNGKLNSEYDPSQPEGKIIFKKADDSKSNYVTVKDSVTKKNMTVFTSDETTGKFKNVYQKSGSDKLYYKSDEKDSLGKKIEKEASTSNLWYNKGGEETIDISTGKSTKKYSKVTTEKVSTKERTQKSSQMAETNDASTLISKYNTQMEKLYANYANTLKKLANEARKTAYYTENSKYNPSAKNTYSKEVESLNNKIDISEKNKPKERQAQVLATSRANAKIQGSGTKLTKEETKKIKQQELSKARSELNAKRTKIDISDSEWEAIQAGALSDAKLRKLFNYADTDALREKATPRSRKTVTDSMISRIKSMQANGKTNAEIASALGLSAATVAKYGSQD